MVDNQDVVDVSAAVQDGGVRRKPTFEVRHVEVCTFRSTGNAHGEAVDLSEAAVAVAKQAVLEKQIEEAASVNKFVGRAERR